MLPISQTGQCSSSLVFPTPKHHFGRVPQARRVCLGLGLRFSALLCELCALCALCAIPLFVFLCALCALPSVNSVLPSLFSFFLTANVPSSP
jgi:hypothetical protein